MITLVFNMGANTAWSKFSEHSCNEVMPGIRILSCWRYEKIMKRAIKKEGGSYKEIGETTYVKFKIDTDATSFLLRWS